MTRPFLPYSRHLIEDDDVNAVVAALRSGWIATGPAIGAFEDALSKVTGASNVVALSSGTAALHLAASALGLGAGDTVVVPTITFLATANAARFVGAEVVFADVDPETGLMGPEELQRALTEAKGGDAGAGTVRAVFPVHLAGQSLDPAGIREVAETHGLRIVEDACHSLGTTYTDGDGTTFRTGACDHAEMTAFSFHPAKTVAMGEGGAVTTNDSVLAARLRSLRNHGMTREAADFANAGMAFAADGAPNPWYYEMPEFGFNYRASDLHCALGLSQLGKLERFVDARRRLVTRYDALLAPLAPVVRPLGRVAGCHPGWHLYVTLIDFKSVGISRAQVMNGLRERGIGTQVHYIPVHLQPYYRHRYGDAKLPGAMAYYQRCLTLPLFPGMEEHDAEQVVTALTDELGL